MDNAVRQKNTNKPHFLSMVYDHILDGGKFIGMLMALIICLGISLHVFMRYFFGLPINWFIDIATLFLFYITFLGAAWLLRENGHVSLDFLFHAIGPEKYGKVEIITNFICAVACLVIAYYGVLEMMLSIELEIVVDMPLAPPKWIVLVLIPIGFLMLAIEFLRKVFKGLTLKKNNQ